MTSLGQLTIYPARELPQPHLATRLRLVERCNLTMDLPTQTVRRVQPRAVRAQVEDEPLADDREKGIGDPAEMFWL